MKNADGFTDEFFSTVKEKIMPVLQKSSKQQKEKTNLTAINKLRGDGHWEFRNVRIGAQGLPVGTRTASRAHIRAVPGSLRPQSPQSAAISHLRGQEVC